MGHFINQLPGIKKKTMARLSGNHAIPWKEISVGHLIEKAAGF